MSFRYLVALGLGLSAGLIGQKSKPSDGQPNGRVTIVQPGAVGKSSRVLSPVEATKAGRLPTDADIQFMQGMIHHHAQAVEMVDLLRTRGLRKDLQAFGERITISQSDEIDYMKRWLEHYGKPAAPAHDHAAHQAAAQGSPNAGAGAMASMPLMPGMLTPQQMAELAAAQGGAFDRLFLTGMIQHHDGALVMVKELLQTPGAGQDPALYDFSTDIDNTQRAEIDLMRRMLNNEPADAGNKPAEAKKDTTSAKAPSVYVNARADSRDPRVGLKAGLNDAGQAALGLQFIATLPKPAGFAPGDAVAQQPPSPPSPSRKERPRQPGVEFGTANSDLAFSGNHLFVGNYNGINFYDIDNPGKIKLRTSVLCPGGQGDVSVYRNLLFMSAEAMNGRSDCGTEGIGIPAGYKPPPPEKPEEKQGGESSDKSPRRPPPPPSLERFRGLRIFDISDLSRPKQVAAVQTCRGSHTHTLVVDPKDKQNVYIYVSGIGSVRQKEELGECSGGEPEKNPDTALFRIDIIQVPLAHPDQARIVNRPRIFADEKSGAANPLWKGGSHGEGTQETSKTDKCHDITVYSELGLAAGACSGNGILLDISNPVHPKRIDAVTDPNFAFWHSASFNNDGTKVLFTDEWGGGAQPRCRESDPMHWGADAIFTLEKGKMTLSSYFKMPASQTETENCVAHNGSLIPVPGRDLMVQAWYQGGISIVDFTDASHPFEVAYFDRGPTDATKRGLGGHWSAYWYNGYIYGAEIARGVDVLRLVPSPSLTQNEIDAANQVHFEELNVQNQPKITWPSNFIVGRAYVDQLERSGALSTDRTGALRSLMLAVEGSRPDRKRRAELIDVADSLEKGATEAKTAADGQRMRALAAIFKERVAARR